MTLNLTPWHLRVVVAVADAHGFTAAAAELGLAQSSLSRTVADVERRLRVRLFDRTTRHVEATPTGRAVVELCRAALADLDTALHHLDGYLAGERGQVTVACLPSVAATVLPPVVASYRAAHPDVRVEVSDGLAADVLDAVRTGAVDLAVTAVPGPLPELQVDELRRDPFSIALPPGHRLAGRPALGWADLDGEPFISFSTDSSIAGPVDRAVRASGAALGPVLQARNVASVAGLVAAGLGVTALPELVLPLVAFAPLALVPVTPTLERRICLVRAPARPASAAATAFVAALVAGA